MNSMLTFTVFTPTYNRAHLLPRVFAALQEQTTFDFEWIIVDDGSTDNTESVVRSFMDEAHFPIRYFFQTNQGKHVAFNAAVSEARGALFLPIDSDDRCAPNALERFLSHWASIPENDKGQFAGVFALCSGPDDAIIGTRFPGDVFDSNIIEAFYRKGVRGDKWGFLRTDVLRKFPFPVVSGELFMTEAIVLNKISMQYMIRFINEPLLFVEYQADGLSARSVNLRMRSPIGAMMYYGNFLSLPVPFHWKIRNCVNFDRFLMHSGKSILREIGMVPSPYRFVCAGLLPVAAALFVRDTYYFK